MIWRWLQLVEYREKTSTASSADVLPKPTIIHGWLDCCSKALSIAVPPSSTTDTSSRPPIASTGNKHERFETKKFVIILTFLFSDWIWILFTFCWAATTWKTSNRKNLNWGLSSAWWNIRNSRPKHLITTLLSCNSTSPFPSLDSSDPFVFLNPVTLHKKIRFDLFCFPPKIIASSN